MVLALDARDHNFLMQTSTVPQPLPILRHSNEQVIQHLDRQLESIRRLTQCLDRNYDHHL